MISVAAHLPLAQHLFRPGERVAVAVSGGSDSVGLLRLLHAHRRDLGLVLSAVHVHHGIRGEQADADQVFVQQLADRLETPLRVFAVDAPQRAALQRESLEEAARALRYRSFRTLLEDGEVDCVATGHTLDDQAETVLMKLLRGAWTEGLGGIYPVRLEERGRILRPLLGAARQAIQEYLRELGQPWREDSSNADPAHTRNRIRHELLPQLRRYNPQISQQLARMAAVAREEEAWWQGEMARITPSLLLPGKPSRGGGRVAAKGALGDSSVSIELDRLRALAPAVRRRVLRAAAAQLDAEIGFDGIERLLTVAGLGEPAAEPPLALRKALSLEHGLLAERTPRELRLLRRTPEKAPGEGLPSYEIPLQGQVTAPEYGVSVRACLTGEAPPSGPLGLVLRPWRPGDRVQLPHSRGPKKVAEVLDRLRVYGGARAGWPVIALGSNLVWMRGVALDPAPLDSAGLRLVVIELASPAADTETNRLAPKSGQK